MPEALPPSPDARDPLSLAQKMWAVNGAAVRALRLAVVKWDRMEDFGHLIKAIKLITEMLAMENDEGNRMLDAMIAATVYVEKPTPKNLKTLKARLDRLWTP